MNAGGGWVWGGVGGGTGGILRGNGNVVSGVSESHCSCYFDILSLHLRLARLRPQGSLHRRVLRASFSAPLTAPLTVPLHTHPLLHHHCSPLPLFKCRLALGLLKAQEYRAFVLPSFLGHHRRKTSATSVDTVVLHIQIALLVQVVNMLTASLRT